MNGERIKQVVFEILDFLKVNLKLYVETLYCNLFSQNYKEVIEIGFYDDNMSGGNFTNRKIDFSKSDLLFYINVLIRDRASIRKKVPSIASSFFTDLFFIRDQRNAWAHGGSIDLRMLYRIIDTSQYILEQINDVVQPINADGIIVLRKEALLLLYQAEFENITVVNYGNEKQNNEFEEDSGYNFNFKSEKEEEVKSREWKNVNNFQVYD